MEDVMHKIYEYLAAYGLQVLAAIIILVIGRWVAKLVTTLVGRLMTRANVEPTLSNFAQNLCYIGLMTFVIIAALSKLGIETASLAVVIGAAGLAIGFALQGTLSNFAAGIMLLIFKPFKVGDYVEAGGKAGTVKEVQIFNTILNAPDNVRITVPNGQVTGTSITNYTVTGTRRLDLVVRPWVKTGDYWALKFDLTEKIKLTFDENDISIPYPQRTVHMINK